MRIASVLFKTAIVLFLVSVNCKKIHAQENSKNQIKNFIAIDVIPLYYDFFDYRKQIRVGFEYERKLNSKWLMSCALDGGLFEEYSFVKYYDFFNQNQGFYSVKQDILIKGFHILPSCNYSLFQSKSKSGQGVFCGGILDINYYRKKLNSFNSQTSEKRTEAYSQIRMGAGVCLSAKYDLGFHIFAEIKTSLFCKFLCSISENNAYPVKPLNSQWTSTNNNFWWISNIKFGYAF